VVGEKVVISLLQIKVLTAKRCIELINMRAYQMNMESRMESHMESRMESRITTISSRAFMLAANLALPHARKGRLSHIWRGAFLLLIHDVNKVKLKMSDSNTNLQNRREANLPS
jgi:hypothetical protein